MRNRAGMYKHIQENMEKHYYISGNGRALAVLHNKMMAELIADTYRQMGYKQVTIDYR